MNIEIFESREAKKKNGFDFDFSNVFEIGGIGYEYWMDNFKLPFLTPFSLFVVWTPHRFQRRGFLSLGDCVQYMYE